MNAILMSNIMDAISAVVEGKTEMRLGRNSNLHYTRIIIPKSSVS